MCDPVKLTTGVALTACGLLTSSYLIYSRFCTSHPVSINIALSETLATATVGILHLYWFAACDTAAGNTTGEAAGTRVRTTCGDNQELWMHHAVMIAAATHCFISLVSASVMCNKSLQTSVKENEKPEEETKKSSVNKKNIFFDAVRSPICGNVIGQWLVPALGVLCLYYIVYQNEICPNTTLTTIVDNFQSVVNELLEQAQVISENDTTTHKEEIKSIVDKVYTIVDSVTNNTVMTTVEENMEMFNIIEKLNHFSVRTPKQIEPKIIYTTSFKVYMVLFIVFVYLIVAYSNVRYAKARMLSGGINSDNRNKHNLQTNVRYLKMLITAAVILWTPSFTELFARTYIGENQPDILSQILMASGTAYMLVRDGINLKLLKANMKTNNCVEPSA